MFKRLLLIASVGILSLLGACTCTVSDDTVYYGCYDDIEACEGDLNIITGANYTIVLSQPVWDDLVITMANAKQPAALAPTWRSYLQSQLPAFEKDAINVLYFNAQLPYSYLEGSDIEFHIHLVYPNAGVGESTWYFSWVWANMNTNYPVVADAVTVQIISPNVADRHQFAEMNAAIDGTGKEISSVLLCSIQRLGNVVDDDYDDEIYLASGDFRYQIDTLGSRTQFDK